MDCMWRHVRDEVLANEPIPDLDITVQTAIDHLDSLTGFQRMLKAGVFSDNFWLADVRSAFLSN